MKDKTIKRVLLDTNIYGLVVSDKDRLKCITPDTELILENIEPGQRILSLNETTGKVEPAKVNTLLDMGIKPVFRVTTPSGHDDILWDKIVAIEYFSEEHVYDAEIESTTIDSEMQTVHEMCVVPRIIFLDQTFTKKSDQVLFDKLVYLNLSVDEE